MLTQGSTVIVLMVALLLVAFVVGLIWWAVAVRRRRASVHRAGPGSPAVPPATQPWRRFACALAAPYARYEWEITRGRLSTVSPEQTYFGYGVCQPWGVVRQALARDWSVRGEKTGNGAAYEAARGAWNAARMLAVADTRIDLGSLPERLARAGVPQEAIDGIDAGGLARVRTEEGQGAAGISDVDAMRNEMAFNICRFANLIRWSAYAGLIDGPTAGAASDMIATAAVIAFGSWDEYADRYLAGLYGVGYSAERARTTALEWLKRDPQSPWAAVRWPA
ncbi:MAG: DUF1266 domain-containing protein [Microbacterium sp.]